MTAKDHSLMLNSR